MYDDSDLLEYVSYLDDQIKKQKASADATTDSHVLVMHRNMQYELEDARNKFVDIFLPDRYDLY